MANESTAIGFLVPVGDVPIEADVELEKLIQPTIVGVSALPAKMVMPRWQVTPSSRPQGDQNWASFGISSGEPDTFHAEVVDSTVVGEDTSGRMIVERDELLNVLVSFFGKNAARYEERFRAGMSLSQNRTALRSNGLALVEVQPPVRLPDLGPGQNAWSQRKDVVLVLRRRPQHIFQVRSIEDAAGMLDNEQYLTPIQVTIPT